MQRLCYTASAYDAATMRQMRWNTVRTTQYVVNVQSSIRTVALTNFLQHTIAFAVRMVLNGSIFVPISTFCRFIRKTVWISVVHKHNQPWHSFCKNRQIGIQIIVHLSINCIRSSLSYWLPPWRWVSTFSSWSHYFHLDKTIVAQIYISRKTSKYTHHLSLQ